MDIVWDPAKEARNRRKHGLDFWFAAAVFADPLAITVFDRVEDGEERWHTIGAIAGGIKVLVVVHMFPDPDDEARVRIIGLREATARERRRYEDEGS